MRSMTGYGKASRTFGKASCAVEIVTVNRKQLDVKITAGPELSPIDQELRRIVASKISRGQVGVKISLRRDKEERLGSLGVDMELAMAYASKIKEISQFLSGPPEISATDIIKLPGVLQDDVAGEIDPATKELATATLEDALEALIKSKSVEGDFLAADISARINTLQSLLDRIEPIAVELPERQRQRLLKNLHDAGLSIASDDERVMKELVVFSDRCDVSEEIARLRSHISQAKDAVSKDDAIGRSMDFLAQEIQREINTLGVKAADTKITPLVVAFKTEAEKIREQAQNVE